MHAPSLFVLVSGHTGIKPRAIQEHPSVHLVGLAGVLARRLQILQANFVVLWSIVGIHRKGPVTRRTECHLRQRECVNLETFSLQVSKGIFQWNIVMNFIPEVSWTHCITNHACLKVSTSCATSWVRAWDFTTVMISVTVEVCR